MTIREAPLTLPEIGEFWGSNAMQGMHALRAFETIFGEETQVDGNTLRRMAKDLYGLRYGLDNELEGIVDLQGVGTIFINILTDTRRRWPRLGVISGVVSSEGREHIPRNMQTLREHEGIIRSEVDYPVFSCADVFSPKVYAQIALDGLTNQSFIEFWQRVFEEGKITDVFMTPRWEISEGARDEFETATRLGLQIHML